MDEDLKIIESSGVPFSAQPCNQLDEHVKGGKKRRYTRFTMAALGSIPWIGGFISASAALYAEADQNKINDLHRQWLEDHEEKISKLQDFYANK